MIQMLRKRSATYKITAAFCLALVFLVMFTIYISKNKVEVTRDSTVHADSGIHEEQQDREEIPDAEDIKDESPVNEPPNEGTGLLITEIVSSNYNSLSDHQGDFPDWIEIYNSGEVPRDLTGFGLSDNILEPLKWTFPQITIESGEYIIIFASGKDIKDADNSVLHTSFKLSSYGETLLLTDPSGRYIDQVKAGRIGSDISYGRTISNGEYNNNWAYFDKPTPGMPNEIAAYGGYASDPIFKMTGGFYSAPVLLELQKRAAQSEIRYTTDGSEPDQNSKIYSSPIAIDQTTVVRARVFEEGLLPSSTITHTFFINQKHDLSVISVALDPFDLWDTNEGIYVKGNKAQSDFPYFGANYHQDWEKASHLELFEPNGNLGFRINGGLKIFGGWTRAYDQKSFGFYARNRYESKEMTYPLFLNKPLMNYKHLVLRTSGQDVFKTKIRDIMMTSLIQDTGLDYQGYRQVVLYINGEYWGIYNIREKINRYFIAGNHGIEDLDTIDILEGNAKVKAGEADHYLEMMDFITQNDLSIPENYEYIKTQMDVSNFMDFQISQMYFANVDMGNIRFWRERVPEGKWRWIVFDTDLGFGSVNHDTVWFLLNPAGTGHGNMFSTRLINNLMKNNEFKDEFVKRFAYHLNNTFEAGRVLQVIDDLAANIESEIPNNLNRWTRPESFEYWQSQVNQLRMFAVNRHQYLLKYIQKHFNLTNEEMKIFDAFIQ